MLNSAIDILFFVVSLFTFFIYSCLGHYLPEIKFLYGEKKKKRKCIFRKLERKKNIVNDTWLQIKQHTMDRRAALFSVFWVLYNIGIRSWLIKGYTEP